MNKLPALSNNRSADLALEALSAMDASKAERRTEADISQDSSSGKGSPSRNVLASASDRSSSRAVPKVSLGPILHDRYGKAHEVHAASRSDSPNDAQLLRREMETQEKIIVALQRDNEALLKEKKETVALYKDLGTKYEHLEAKHSLLLSAQQDLGARSNLRVSNDAAKLADLQARVTDLQSALEAEKAKRLPGSFPTPGPRQAAEESTLNRASPHLSDKAADYSLDEASARAVVTELGDHTARLREYERMHEVHKSTIDALHSEVERLEQDKKRLEERQRLYVRQVDELQHRTHELEDTVMRKKESIGELLRTCQDSAAHTLQLKKQAARIHSLEAALAEKDEFTQQAMDRLRSESKEVCERYQKTIAALQSRPVQPQDSLDLQRRINALEKENFELRRAVETSKATPLRSGNATSPAEDSKPMEELVAAADSDGGISGAGVSPSPNADVLRLEAMLSNAAAESVKQKQISSDLQAELAGVRADWDVRVRELKRGFASQLQLMRARHNEELERLEANHQSELLTMSHRRREDEREGFSEKLIRIVEKKGLDASLVAVCERLNYLEKRSLHKEEEMAYELSEVQRIAEMEKRVLKEQTFLLLEQKNTQIKAFRLQLDELLSSIAVLQATS